MSPEPDKFLVAYNLLQRSVTSVENDSERRAKHSQEAPVEKSSYIELRRLLSLSLLEVLV